jgi:hypothetical protein
MIDEAVDSTKIVHCDGTFGLNDLISVEVLYAPYQATIRLMSGKLAMAERVCSVGHC